MEVHHHPDLHHRRKKFKEYFLEFLMIFLAVTMGFLAENIREHITNRSKEKEYIIGFIRDLKTDTANMKRVIDIDSIHVQTISRFLLLQHADMRQNVNRRNFYSLALENFYNSASFSSNDATLQQLKSTGDYRLIRRDHVSDSISRYDREMQEIAGETAFYKDYFKDILSMLEEQTEVTIYGDTGFVKNGEFTDKNYPLPDTASKQYRTLFNKVFNFRIITDSYAKNYLAPELKKASRLISFLKKEYDLDDDEIN